jgi:hypothetical protein
VVDSNIKQFRTLDWHISNINHNNLYIYSLQWYLLKLNITLYVKTNLQEGECCMKDKKKPDEFQDFIVLQIIVFGFLISLAMTIFYWIGRIGLYILIN